MALFTPGPLISDIRGTLNGCTFSRSGATRIIRRTGARRQTPTPATENVHNLFRLATASWTALSAADKLAWSAWAQSSPHSTRLATSRPLSGRQLYLATWLHQSGAITPTAPSLPSLPAAAAPLIPTAQRIDSTLWLTALNRTLAADELPLIHVYRPETTSHLRSRGKLLRIVPIPSTSYLYQLVDLSLAISANNQYASTSGDITTSIDKTLEFFWQPTVPQPFSLGRLFTWSAGQSGIAISTNGYWDLWADPSYYTLYSHSLTPAWYYAAVTWTNSTVLCTLYLNGAYAGQHTFPIPAGFTTDFFIGLPSPTNLNTGLVDNVRLSNITRSPSFIAAAWNSGNPPPFTADANTVALWNFDGTSLPIIPDLSGHGHSLNIVNASLGPGYQAIPLAYTADAPQFASPRTWLRTAPNASSNSSGRSLLNYVDW